MVHFGWWVSTLILNKVKLVVPNLWKKCWPKGLVFRKMQPFLLLNFRDFSFPRPRNTVRFSLEKRLFHWYWITRLRLQGWIFGCSQFHHKSFTPPKEYLKINGLEDVFPFGMAYFPHKNHLHPWRLPENQWLEDVFPFWDGLFSGAMTMFVSGRVTAGTQFPGGLVQIIFPFFSWVMTVGSSR